jgi:Apea-like HEPN
MKRFYAGSNSEEELLSIAKGFPTRKARIPISAEVNGGNRRAKEHPNYLAAAAANSYLHDVFLILNLCAPGCCDFYRGTLVTTASKTDVSLSNIDFEFALLGSFEKNWPSIKRLPLDQTMRWFDAVRPNAHQIPQNAMEKVLFALLHLATLDVDPMRVIWLFYALESLLETKAGENFSALVRRMGALLALDDQQSKILRTKFRTLYDIRSAIVHGGFEVAHPMHNEMLDERVSENFRRWRDAADYGITALVAAVQNIILRDWKYPNFAEEVYGVPLGEDGSYSCTVSER